MTRRRESLEVRLSSHTRTLTQLFCPVILAQREKKKPVYCHSYAGNNIAFTQFCHMQPPDFTNKTADHPAGLNILHFYRQANDGLEERPTSCNKMQKEETSDLALKYPLGD